MFDAIATLVVCLVVIPVGTLVVLIRGIDNPLDLNEFLFRDSIDSPLYWPPVRPRRRT